MTDHNGPKTFEEARRILLERRADAVKQKPERPPDAKVKHRTFVGAAGAKAKPLCGAEGGLITGCGNDVDCPDCVEQQPEMERRFIR